MRPGDLIGRAYCLVSDHNGLDENLQLEVRQPITDGGADRFHILVEAARREPGGFRSLAIVVDSTKSGEAHRVGVSSRDPMNASACTADEDRHMGLHGSGFAPLSTKP